MIEQSLREPGNADALRDSEEALRLLYVAASRILRRDAALWCPLKVWAVRLAQRVGVRRARVALARKLAVVLHAMWSDGQVFQWRRTKASASA